MKNICAHSLLMAILLLYAGSSTAGESSYYTDRPAWSGMWTDAGPDRDITPYLSYIAGTAGRIRWMNVEKSEGVYDWSEILQSLTKARENNYYYYFIFWTGPVAPEWIYTTGGVPKVIFADKSRRDAPYYLNDNYRKYVKRFISNLAEFLANLDPSLLERLAFVQPGFGATGDRQLYKAPPLDPQYAINSDQYVAFMKEMTLHLVSEFKKYPQTAKIKFLFNLDDFDDDSGATTADKTDRKRGEMLYAQWMRQNFDCQLRKQQFTDATGYMAVNEKDDDDAQRPSFFGYSRPPKWGGNPEYVRGEQNDPKFAETPMAIVSQQWHYYWTAISTVDRGLDFWETNWKYLFTGKFAEAYKFASRYSGYKKAETSPYAFVALRDVLDYSDGERFPAREYGEVSRDNTQRINKILEKYRQYGARNDDNDAVKKLGGYVYLEKSKGLNDCVWNVIARNYSRFMTQYDPNGTSVGLWRVGSVEEPYGRFARSFEGATGRNAMYFSVESAFFGGEALNGRYPVEVRVIYFDKGVGSWELRYDAVDNRNKTAYRVTKTDTGRWVEKRVTLTDARFGKRCPNQTDLYLYNTDTEDDIFHLVELKKI